MKRILILLFATLLVAGCATKPAPVVKTVIYTPMVGPIAAYDQYAWGTNVPRFIPCKVTTVTK